MKRSGQVRIYEKCFCTLQANPHPGRLLCNANVTLSENSGRWILELEPLQGCEMGIPRNGWMQLIFGDEVESSNDVLKLSTIREP